jgi:hypothetical protein
MWQGWAQFGLTVARRSAQVRARRSARQEGRARRAPWAAEHIHRPSTGNAPRALPPQRCGAHARRDATSTGRNANAPQAAGVSGTRAPSPVSSMPVGRALAVQPGSAPLSALLSGLGLPCQWTPAVVVRARLRGASASGHLSPTRSERCRGRGWQDVGCSPAAASAYERPGPTPSPDPGASTCKHTGGLK